MPRLAIALLLFSSAALARPTAGVVSEANLPLRVVVRADGVRMSNCVFAKQPIPPHARPATPRSDRFNAGDSLWARCYLPDRPGGNRPGDLTDVFYLDGKQWWTQAYDAPVPPDALERQVALGEVLRTSLSMLPRGVHRIEMVGMLKRHGRSLRIYHGMFHYVR